MYKLIFSAWKTPLSDLEVVGGVTSGENKYKLDLETTDYSTAINLVLVFFPEDVIKVSLQNNDEDITSFTWSTASADSSCGYFTDTGITCTEPSYWMIIKLENQDVKIFCEDQLKFYLQFCGVASEHADYVYFDEGYANLKFFWSRYDYDGNTGKLLY